MSPKELVLALFTAAFADHEPEAARQLVTSDYIQHNPQVPTGAEGLVGLIPLVAQSGMTVTTHRVITEGDLVVLHNTFDGADAFYAVSNIQLSLFVQFKVRFNLLFNPRNIGVSEHLSGAGLFDNLCAIPLFGSYSKYRSTCPKILVYLTRYHA